MYHVRFLRDLVGKPVLVLVLCAVGLYIPGSMGAQVAQGAPIPPMEIGPQYTACSGERIDAVQYIDTDTTWTLASSPRHVTKHIEVMPGTTLTIEPGVEVWVGEKLYIHICSGAEVVAKGTPDQHIVFTRYKPDQGPRWNKMWFHGNSTSYFRYTDFSYAGAAASSDDSILHYEGTGTHVLNNCSVEASKQQGIVASGDGLNVTIAGTRFARNGRRSVMVDSGANVTISGSSFEDEQEVRLYLRKRPVPPTITVRNSNFPVVEQWNGAYNEMGNETCIDAQENWWGAANGPADGSNDNDSCGLGTHWGSGTRVDDGVDYRNWRATEAPQVGITTPPTATFTVDPDPTVPHSSGTEYTFDASGSADVEDYASSLEVCWDWDNDGACDTDWKTEKTATHSFSAASSSQTVRLVVRDTDGDTSEATQNITLNTPPVPAFSYIQTAWNQVTFDASSSSDAEDDTADLRVAWNFEGTSTPDTGYVVDKTASYTYSHQGRYWPTLYVKDSHGVTSTLRKPLDITPPTASRLLTGTADALTSEDNTVQVTMSTDAGGTLLLYGIEITHTPQLMPVHGGLKGGWLYQGFTLEAYSMFDDQPIDAISGTYTITISYDEGYFADVLNLPFEEKLALYRWSGSQHSWGLVTSTLNPGDELVATTNSFGDFALVVDVSQIYLPLITKSS